MTPEDGRELFALAMLHARGLVDSGRISRPYTVVLSGSNGALIALRIEENAEYEVTAKHGVPGLMARPVAIFLHGDNGSCEALVVQDAPRNVPPREAVN